MARKPARRRGGGRSLKPAEARGFAGAVLSCAALCVYLAWAFIPDSTLSSLGITYYPSKEWAVTIPAYILVTIALALVAYEGLNHLYASPTAEPTHAKGHYSPDEISKYLSRPGEPELRIPPIQEIPASVVQQILDETQDPGQGSRPR